MKTHNIRCKGEGMEKKTRDRTNTNDENEEKKLSKKIISSFLLFLVVQKDESIYIHYTHTKEQIGNR